ncbi:MFS general substrate transporter [Marasmius fiardii PR-910]|nr:MFS general substrate transporter [Marasmius fiardii PR-910]
MSVHQDRSEQSVELSVVGAPDSENQEKNQSTTFLQELRNGHDGDQSAPIEYKVYKRRYVGVLGVILLNIVGGMSWPWFGPISNSMVEDWGITLTEVSWLGNVTACLYLPVALIMPGLFARYSIRRCCDLGAICLIIGAWVRYSGTANGLSSSSAYALFFIGQAFGSVSQTIYQVLAPIYSEKWFDLKSRTTATMICAIANPIGSALGQLISPLAGSTKQSIFVLAIISTAVTPAVFLVQSVPPTPPTFAASQKPPPFSEFLKGLFGRSKNLHMTVRDRIDFGVMCLVFGFLVAATNAFSILTGAIMGPAGYNDDTSGLMGATLLLSGIVAALVVSPLMDRVFTKHLAVTLKCFLTALAGAWLSLIWAVKPNNTGGLFAVMAVIGVTSVTMLPVGLELACDVTQNAEASSSLMWFTANACTIIFVLVEDALRASPNATPPLNMRRALIFQATFVILAAVLTMCIRGKQKRKELDERKAQEVANAQPTP